ncbi:MAG: hypothetical protein P8P30_00470 [Rickettsiales bacterium]|nr:hypothetical protein [Rickettsiales bacterium]
MEVPKAIKLTGQSSDGSISVEVIYEGQESQSTYTWHHGPKVSCHTMYGENLTCGDDWLGSTRTTGQSHRASVTSQPHSVQIDEHGTTNLIETINLSVSTD